MMTRRCNRWTVCLRLPRFKSCTIFLKKTKTVRADVKDNVKTISERVRPNCICSIEGLDWSASSKLSRVHRSQSRENSDENTYFG